MDRFSDQFNLMVQKLVTQNFAIKIFQVFNLIIFIRLICRAFER
jgi:hypothetical protein